MLEQTIFRRGAREAPTEQAAEPNFRYSTSFYGYNKAILYKEEALK